MAQYRSQSPYQIGSEPPQSVWTIVSGDTASFKMYVQDDSGSPLVIEDWSIEMQIKRPTSSNNAGAITDAAALILTLYPEPDADDGPGEFTVSLTAAQSETLQTGDIFDIELSTPQDQIVWTVAQGSMIILEDVTD
jgi:hypothetical protein